MKRLVLFATAAIVALASCTKTQVVYNDAPEEIGFKAVTGVMTKADLAGHTTMGVFAYFADEVSQKHLDNEKFVEKANYWGAEATKYWPLEGKLDFAVYAPHDNTVTYDNTTKKLAIKVDNSAAQTDWLYGKTMATEVSKGETVNVTLRHALAQVTASITSDLEGLVVKSLVLNSTEQVETLTVDYTKSDEDYTDGDARLSWSATATNEVAKTLIGENTLQAGVPVNNDAAPCYVIPSTQTSLLLTYRLPDTAVDLTKTIELGNGGTNKWIEGYSYVYNINIGATEIKLNPTVTPRTAAGSVDETVVPES